ENAAASQHEVARAIERSTHARALCKREDVEQFDVETVGRAGRELRDPVTLFEDQHELLSRVVDSIDLLEPELERRRLLPFDKHHARLYVVRAAELVAFPELELPVLAGPDPVFECRDVDAQRVVDFDVDGRVRPVAGCVAWLNRDRGHTLAV